MLMYSSTLLLQTTEPWVYRVLDHPESVAHKLSACAARSGLDVFDLDGKAMQTAGSFYDELARGLKLPEYFGRNLNALDECLVDLEWFDAAGFILFVRNAEGILRVESSEKLDGFLDVLQRAGREWSKAEGPPRSRSPKPFHSVLQCASELWRPEIPVVKL